MKTKISCDTQCRPLH